MSTVFFTFSLSLFDSLSTAQQIVVFALLLTTINPVRNSMSFLLGLSLAYLACGIVGHFFINQLLEILGKYFPSTANMSNTHYYQWELFLGLAMAIFGFLYFLKKRHALPTPSQNMMIARLKSMNSFLAFVMGAFISVSSFPFSVPYIIALGKYSTLHLKPAVAIGNIILYNVGYALPMIVILIIYMFVRRNVNNLSGTLQEKTYKLNIHLTSWTLVGVGIFSMLDAACYLVLGHALVNGRYF